MSRFDNLTDAELEQLRRMVEYFDTIDVIDDDMLTLIEKHWPWLLSRGHRKSRISQSHLRIKREL